MYRLSGQSSFVTDSFGLYLSEAISFFDSFPDSSWTATIFPVPLA